MGLKLNTIITLENQEKYIAKDTCDKITNIVIKELNRGNI